MISTNFNQLLCKTITEDGENISGVFDTLICDRGKNDFFICVFFSQIIDLEGTLDKYYYRIVLRYLGNNRTDFKHSRVDSGIFWDGMDDASASIHDQVMYHKTTHPGSSGRLSINYGFDFDMQGNYEVDLYVKKLESTDTLETCNQLPVRDLDLVSISPFQVIFQNS